MRLNANPKQLGRAVVIALFILIGVGLLCFTLLEQMTARADGPVIALSVLAGLVAAGAFLWFRVIAPARRGVAAQRRQDGSQ